MRGRTRLISVLVLAVAAAWTGSAEAKPRLAGVFDLSGIPGQITRGPDNNIWVTISGSSDNKTLARIRPNGNVTEYDPANLVNPVGIRSGPDGNLWFTRNNGVIEVDPDDPEGSNQDYAVNAISDPRELTKGPGGLMWTGSGDQLVSFDVDDPTGFDTTTIDGMAARGIASSGGKLWIADFANGDVVRANPDGGVRRINVGGGPQDVARGPQKGVAYTNQATDPHTVGRIFPPKNRARRTKVPNTDPFGIVFGPDRKWWIANFAKDNLTILDRKGKDRRFRNLPDGSGPRWITNGPNNTIWVSLEGSNQVARIKGVKR